MALGRSPRALALLAAAEARLHRLSLYPTPVRTGRVRLVSAPAFFRLPLVRRFVGYAAWDLILVKRPLDEVSEDLVVHELCHVWQMQHHPIAMPLSYLRFAYAANPHELEARRAVALTR